MSLTEFQFRGRTQNGKLVSGNRFAASEDKLCDDLIAAGITPVDINVVIKKSLTVDDFLSRFERREKLIQELSIFARQMQILHKAGVPITTALRQIATFTRSTKLKSAINDIVVAVENGEKLSKALAGFPDIFSALLVNIVQVGENTGELSKSFEHLHHYLEFELRNVKQLQAAFRYPIFVLTAVVFAIVILNIFVIPTFAGFYSKVDVSLPWQTKILIFTSSLFTDYWYYLLMAFSIFFYLAYRYLHSEEGRLHWDKTKLTIPLIGSIIKRTILIHISQTMAIVINAGLSLPSAFKLTKDVVQNEHTKKQIDNAESELAHGQGFTKCISKIDLFSPLELQIINVGENNGELGSAMQYISEFHSQEVEYEIKQLNDWIGPLLIAFISGLILIVALGIYLPIWNMTSLAQ